MKKLTYIKTTREQFELLKYLSNSFNGYLGSTIKMLLFLEKTKIVKPRYKDDEKLINAPPLWMSKEFFLNEKDNVSKHLRGVINSLEDRILSFMDDNKNFDESHGLSTSVCINQEVFAEAYRLAGIFDLNFSQFAQYALAAHYLLKKDFEIEKVGVGINKSISLTSLIKGKLRKTREELSNQGKRANTSAIVNSAVKNLSTIIKSNVDLKITGTDEVKQVAKIKKSNYDKNIAINRIRDLCGKVDCSDLFNEVISFYNKLLLCETKIVHGSTAAIIYNVAIKNNKPDHIIYRLSEETNTKNKTIRRLANDYKKTLDE